MKILYHHRIRSRDGQYVHVSEIVNSLQQQGHDVVLVGPVIVDNAPHGLGAGWVAKFKNFAPGALYELIELAYSVYDFARLARAIHRHQPDIIYERYNLFFLSGIWAKRLFSLPLLLEVNAPLVHERGLDGGLALRRLGEWAETFVWQRADTVLPVTGVLRRMIEERGVESSRIEVITNGVNVKTFRREEHCGEASTLTRNAEAITVGFVGYLREWHRLDRVIALLSRKRNSNTRFLIVGVGPARKSLERQSLETGVADRVEFVGDIGREDLPSFLCRFDIALQPSVVDYASPLKLQEYMAMGCAIVAPDKENIREVLTHGHNAILFDAEDDADFEKAVQELCSDGELRRRIGQAAVETIHAKGLTWDDNAHRIVEIAGDLLRKSQ